MAEKIGDRLGFSGKPWPQYPAEIDGFIALLKSEGVTSYMEIGCRYGDTFHAVGCALPQGSRLIAIDLPGAKSGFTNKGGHQDSGTYLSRAAKDLSKRGQTTHVIIGDSHESKTLARATALGPIDVLFIDGDHTADGVRKDLEQYGPLAKIVAFHDICGEGKWAKQIRPIYDKACKGRRHVEFSFDGKRRGIGVIWK